MTTPFTFDALNHAETLALDASAGTGKTHTLTTIALRLLAEGRVGIEQLLIVTFTNAATAELKVRLLAILRQALNVLDGAPNNLDETTANWLSDTDETTLALRRKRIDQAVMAFDDASIVTIHGFCQRMLTFVGVSAGLSIDTAVTDDDDVALHDTLDDIAASVIGSRAQHETAFLIGGAKLARENISDLAQKVLQLPQLRLTDDLWHDTDLDSVPALQAALDDVFAIWTDALNHARELLPHTKEELEPLVRKFLTDPFFTQPSNQKTYRETKIALAAQALATFLTTAATVPPIAVDPNIKGIQEEAAYLWFTHDAIKQFELPGQIPDTTLTAVSQRLAAARDQVITQARNVIAHGIWQRYQRHRTNRQVMTYDDLLRQLHQALTDPKRAELTRTMLRSQYTTALIDEFQDTDAVQWGIFSAVFSPADPLIVIGDPKQAIYQFRGADVATYLRARDTMRHVFTLDTNWRSDSNHVAAINAIFDTTGAFEPYGITYLPSHATHDNRLDGPAINSGINVRELSTNGDSKGQSTRRIVDDMAAHAVTVLADTTLRDGETLRPITPRDIAVLVRTNRLARQVQAALNARGVPAAIQRGGSVYASQDAAALHQLLAAIARPHATPLVCGAAASSLIQMPTVLLAAIQDGTATGGQQATFVQFTQALVSWQTLWRQHGVFAAIMAATGHFAATVEADRMLTNVRHLAELLATVEETHQFGPDALVAWLAQKRGEVDTNSYRPEESDELRLDGNDDAVRIATIHGAKGLEYPIVFIGDLWMTGPQSKPGLISFTDPDATPHAKPTLDVSLPLYTKPPSRSSELASRDSKAEQVRLAYVALTRAAHATVVWCPDAKRDDTSALGAVMANQEPDATYSDIFTSIATNHGAPITHTNVTTPANTRYMPTTTPLVALTSRTQQRTRFDTPYRHTSFSALTRHNQTHASVFAVSRSQGGDDDRDDTRTDVPQGGVTLPLATFPRGTRAGNLLHSVFEQLDFMSATKDTLTATLTQAAERSRFTSLNVDEAAGGILQVLNTPLGHAYDDATLRQIPRHARADEMAFTVPLANPASTVTLSALTPVLAQSRDPLLTRLAAQLDADPYRIGLAGFLTGSIDSLLRLPNGKYVVVDYKSNYIGDLNGDTHLACYAPTTALANTMTEHLYTLQALLYLVVTHRYLARRINNYDPATHLHGAAYLFVRGMAGQTTPDEHGMRFGVASVTPEPDVLDHVNAILAKEERR
ncbi:MAG: UvrD-helicase domain-containing protein [Nitriliruptoraceae bacterium]